MYRKYYIFILLNVIAVIVYIPTFSNDFQYFWDDQWQVINKYTSAGFNWQNISEILTNIDHGQYSPINQIIYTFIYVFHFYNPIAYHCFSLLLHIFNSCLVYIFVDKLFSKNNIVDCVNGKTISLITSVLFVIHPVNVEAVAWISASKIPLYSVFYLAGLLSYIYYIEQQKIKYLLLTLLLYILSFASKEQALVFPFSLLLLDWFFKRDLKSERVWSEKLIFLVLSIFMSTVTIMAQGLSSLTSEYSLWKRLLLSCYAIFEYLTKIIFPIRLNYLYPYPMLSGEDFPIRFYLYPILIYSILCLIYSYKKNRLIIFSVAFFLINISLSLNIIPLGRFAMVADRYLYLSEIGLFIIISYTAIYLYEYYKSSKMKTYLIYSLLGIYLIYLSTYSFYYATQWRDSDTIKKYMIELNDEI